MSKKLLLGALLGAGISLLNKERRQSLASGAAQPGLSQASGSAGGAAGAAGGIGALADVAKKLFGQAQGKSAGAVGAGAGMLGELFGGGGKFSQKAAAADVSGASIGTVEGEDQADLLLKAMVAAAQADGNISPQEQEKIAESLGGQLGASEISELKELFANPVDVNSLLSQVKDPATALKVYLVSAMTVNPNNPQDQRYIEQLSSALGISGQAAQAIQQHLNQAQSRAA